MLQWPRLAHRHRQAHVRELNCFFCLSISHRDLCARPVINAETACRQAMHKKAPHKIEVGKLHGAHLPQLPPHRHRHPHPSSTGHACGPAAACLCRRPSPCLTSLPPHLADLCLLSVPQTAGRGENPWGAELGHRRRRVWRQVQRPSMLKTAFNAAREGFHNAR